MRVVPCPRFAIAQDFKAESGRGLSCLVNGKEVFIGNREWMAEHNAEIDPRVEATLRSYERDGNTAICVGVNGELAGVLGVMDVVKEEAKSTVSALQRMGIQVWMVTGDNQRTADALAAQVGITNVLAQVLPAVKATKVRELQAQGMQVAMVGDGINDSPALAAADLGLAIGNGTEVAIEAADVVLVRDNLHGVVTALDLSRVVFNRIRLNMVWAMAYNVIGIPIAAGILFPFLELRLRPEFAALAMALSSVSVVLSSLALRFYKAPEVEPATSATVPVKAGSKALGQASQRGCGCGSRCQCTSGNHASCSCDVCTCESSSVRTMVV